MRGWTIEVRSISCELLTWANVVTAIRLAGGLTAFGAFWIGRQELWNFVGLGVYWLGDVLDGYLARRLRQETVFGAQFDILSDRILVCLFYLGYVSLQPAKTPAALLFLLEFAVVDHYLSNQFLRWPIKSPNYFYAVDRTIWLWNWSWPGKLLNSALVTVVIVTTRSAELSSAVCLAIITLKLWTAIRLRALPPPEATWAAPR